MKSAVENLGPTRVKLTVEVPFEELKPSLDAAYSTIGSQIQVPGFRKGKVPARIIDQRVGRGMVLQKVINDTLPNFYGQALTENNVRSLGQPEVDITDVPTDDSNLLKFDVEVDTVPDFKLPNFSKVKVEVDPLEVTDEDADAELQALRERFGTLVAVERAAANSDSVTIDLIAKIGDERIDNVTGVSYLVGSGNMFEGMDEAITGLSAGECKTFTAPFASGKHEGEDADITVVVQGVKACQLPDLDDGFAQMASQHDTLEELKVEVAEQTERGKRLQQSIQARDKALEQILDDLDLPLPDAITEAEVNQHLEGEDRLEDDEHRVEVDKAIRRAFKTQLILEKIVERDEVQISQEKLTEYLIMLAQQYGMDPKQFAQSLDQQGQMSAIMSEVARREALASILEEVEVVDANGESVELNTLDIKDAAEFADEDEKERAKI